MIVNVYGVEVEVRYREVWYDDKVIFHTDPGVDLKREIIQYLYEEGFIRDRRTPTKIIELS